MLPSSAPWRNDLERPLICRAFENKTAVIPGSTNDTSLMLLSLATSLCCQMLPFRVLYELRGDDKSRRSELQVYGFRDIKDAMKDPEDRYSKI